mmetsp:Transcript_79770/g.258395  ORF Transcript_79770/g.258395 Transcript_79770/m.258395 type:complete len:340 (-) Transcript_79770:1514-2533(-)
MLRRVRLLVLRRIGPLLHPPPPLALLLVDVAPVVLVAALAERALGAGLRAEVLPAVLEDAGLAVALMVVLAAQAWPAECPEPQQVAHARGRPPARGVRLQPRAAAARVGGQPHWGAHQHLGAAASAHRGGGGDLGVRAADVGGGGAIRLPCRGRGSAGLHGEAGRRGGRMLGAAGPLPGRGELQEGAPLSQPEAFVRADVRRLHGHVLQVGAQWPSARPRNEDRVAVGLLHRQRHALAVLPCASHGLHEHGCHLEDREAVLAGLQLPRGHWRPGPAQRLPRPGRGRLQGVVASHFERRAVSQPHQGPVHRAIVELHVSERRVLQAAAQPVVAQDPAAWL